MSSTTSQGLHTQREPLRSDPRLRTVNVLGVGSHAPEGVLTNSQLSERVSTSDAWIVKRTGIRERRIAEPGVATSDLAAQAALRALQHAEVAPEEIDLILVATATPDHAFPSTASLVQRELGAWNACGFDLSAACSGFLNALMTGHRLLSTGAYRTALVIGAEVLSSIVDPQDRSTCVLFGDGAGAVVLGTDQGGPSVLDHVLGMDGRGADVIKVRAGGSRLPASAETLTAGSHFLELRGQEVFRFAVNKLCDVLDELVQRNGLTREDLDLVIPHQANLRILESAAQRLGMGLDRFVVNLDRYGNTSAASIPMALDEAVRTGRIEEGAQVALVAFGSGLTWAGSLLRWGGGEGHSPSRL